MTVSQDVGQVDRIASLFHRYPVPENATPLRGPFRQDDRSCFVCPLPSEWICDAKGQSEIVVFEDGQPLGPGSCTHDDIRTLGRGRFSHWEGALYFSTSDNTDPNKNGRTYSLQPPRGWKGALPNDPDNAVPEEQPLEFPIPRTRRTEICVAADSIVTGNGPRYCVPVPEQWGSDQESLSTLVLLEDDIPLPFPHAAHADIDAGRKGCYSHWGSSLLFTTSDGSDPRRNGRQYTIVYAEALPLSHVPSQLYHNADHCWTLHQLPRHWRKAIEEGARLVLLEDDRALGPANAPHDEIRSLGGGRYSHWGDAFLFSTSDGSSPRDGKHTYTVVLDRGD